MLTKHTFIAALMASSVLVASAAFAADQMTPKMAGQETSQQKTMDKDVGKLSADGSRAYLDVNAARMAIFDGRTNDAKKLIGNADSEMAKAKTDETIFTKAEADLKSAQPAAADNEKTASNDPAKATDVKTAKAWLPVDGEMAVSEDYSASPAKKAAVADANKSLASGDKKGAMEKLKLADVNIDYAVAVVPLNQTVEDIHKAAMLVNDGKYYEASQKLRDVQDSTRFDVLDINGLPKAAPTDGAAKAVTH